MEPFSSKTVLLVPAFALALCAVVCRAVGEGEVGLSIQTYAGLSVTGTVGTVYTVQYTTNLAQLNDWRAAGMVQLPKSPYLWVDTTAPAAGRRFYRAVAGPTNLVWIPPGVFTMGSPSNEMERFDWEGPQTVVTLKKGFFMGMYEVTQGEYLNVVGNNPSFFRTGASGMGGAITNELRHPVENVSWIDATNYSERLTLQARLAGRLPEGWEYRLPTEAEWEHACRGGTTSAFHYGATLRSGMANFYEPMEYDSSIGTISNHTRVFLGRTSEVGSYQANGWGLYDMHGNVIEWCSDWSDFSGLHGGRVIDPQGSQTGLYRVIRGGSWYSSARTCRSANSFNRQPDFRDDVIGFRVVLAPCQ